MRMTSVNTQPIEECKFFKMRSSLLVRLSTFPLLLMSFCMVRHMDAECNTYEVGISVDDILILFVDGNLISGLSYAMFWQEVNMVNVTCATRLIAIQGYNTMNLCGIRASDTSGYILTNSSWKCTDVYYPGWESVDFDDSMWPAASIVTNKEVYNTSKVLNPNCEWIWTSSWKVIDSKTFAFCRKRIAVNECKLDAPYNQCNLRVSQCVDTPNSYKCNCFKGYVNIDDQTCEEVPVHNAGKNYSDGGNNTICQTGEPTSVSTIDSFLIIIIILAVILGVAILVIIILVVCMVRKSRAPAAVPNMQPRFGPVVKSNDASPFDGYEGLDDHRKDDQHYEAIH